MVEKTPSQNEELRQKPFRRAVLRGLAVVLPPLLTIVIFLWVWNTVRVYVLVPIENGARHVITIFIIDNPLEDVPQLASDTVTENGRVEQFQFKGETYQRVPNGSYVPLDVYEEVNATGPQPAPTTGRQYLDLYVEHHYLAWYYVIPVFLACFIGLLYLLGKFLAAGVGRFMWNVFETVINSLPIVRPVYSSVKQVTDFVFSERDIEYTRVVAVEYPRRGMWSLGFVTGESMADIRSAANEQVVSCLIPTSPMPATGFTVSVPKSETVDLDITIDQAFQFCVSCGVVVPKHQQLKSEEVAQLITSSLASKREASE